jgi:hypothetical protein
MKNMIAQCCDANRRVNRKYHVLFLLLFFLTLQESQASALSQQYTATWKPEVFFPLETTQFRIDSVKNETGHDASFDILEYLRGQTRDELTARGFEETASGNPDVIRIELRIHLYQEGGTFGRWLGGGAGAAYAVVYCAFRINGETINAELLTVSAIGSGGIFSAGAEKSVLKDSAIIVADFLQGGNKK